MNRLPGFDSHAIAERLLQEAYRLLAGLPLLLLALLVAWLAWLLGGWLSRRALIARLDRRNPFVTELARSTVRWLVFATGVIVGLEILQATALVGAVLGTAGVLGVALGFAFKDILENYLAGILMSLRQPFAPKDAVVIGEHEGIVMALNSRATVLMTRDGNHLRLPNAMVFRSVILNYTRNPNRRFAFDVGVGVQEDLVAAQSIGLAELAKVDGVLAQPPPRALIVGLGDSNVQLRFRGWMDQRSHDFEAVKSEAIRRTKLALEAAGMDMPEPIYRVQLSGAVESAGQGGPAAKPEVAPVAKARVPDTHAHADIDTQIARDELSDGQQLLDPAAPRE